MTDRIVLTDMRFEARHGVHDWERHEAQPFEVDVELSLDLRPAGTTDDLGRTIDYGRAYDVVRRNLEGESRQLLEALAESIARDLLADFDVLEVVVRVRKPGVRLGGPLAHASVEIRRSRTGSAAGGPGPEGH
jgi:7,8-dihydroneopterin aldolase/epimerase/oxygenase